jgi:hypothetical protein
MYFGLFIASGSFFFGQMKFLPKALRILSAARRSGSRPAHCAALLDVAGPAEEEHTGYDSPYRRAGAWES